MGIVLQGGWRLSSDAEWEEVLEVFWDVVRCWMSAAGGSSSLSGMLNYPRLFRYNSADVLRPLVYTSDEFLK